MDGVGGAGRKALQKPTNHTMKGRGQFQVVLETSRKGFDRPVTFSNSGKNF